MDDGTAVDGWCMGLVDGWWTGERLVHETSGCWTVEPGDNWARDQWTDGGTDLLLVHWTTGRMVWPMNVRRGRWTAGVWDQCTDKPQCDNVESSPNGGIND